MKGSMYMGKEICQGCQKSGAESPRVYKDRLCKTCQECLDKGRALDVSYEPHARVNMHLHSFRSWELNSFLHGILSALHNPTADTKEGVCIAPLNAGYQGDNKRWYNIPSRCEEPILEYARKLSDTERALEKQRDSLPGLIQKMISEEKDVIYQKGVADGQNLLMQLESGALSMEDFAKNLKR